jgi:hypothetical protein
MSAVIIRRTLDSTTLDLPELRPLIGKAVEIVVREERTQPATEEEWIAFFAQGADDLIDPELYKQYREFDRQQWKAPEL